MARKLKKSVYDSMPYLKESENEENNKRKLKQSVYEDMPYLKENRGDDDIAPVRNNYDHLTTREEIESELDKAKKEQTRFLTNDWFVKQWKSFGNYITGNKDKAQKILDEMDAADENVDTLRRKKAELDAQDRQKEFLKKYSGIFQNADFAEKSAYKSTKNDSWWSWLTTDRGLGYDDLAYEYINNVDGTRDLIDNDYIANMQGNADQNPYEYKGYGRLTEDEVKAYNYIYATGGKEAAEEFLGYLTEALNSRTAVDTAERLKDNTFAQILYGGAVGADQFRSGIKGLGNMIAGEEEYVAPSVEQIAGSLIREDLADDSIPTWYNFKEGKWEDKILGASTGQFAYDAVSTGTNMIPSIVASTGVGAFNPALGVASGGAMIGGSAAGNAYQTAINNGYDADAAALYGTSVGVFEATLQTMLGGIGKLGGTSKYLTKAVSGIDNALLRFSAKYAGQIGSEALEEGLQEVLDPLLQNAILGADEEINWEEAAYSALLGGFMGATMGGGDTDALTHSEQQVVNNVYDSALKQAAADGKTLTSKDKNKIYDTVVEQMEKGQLDVDTIESVLGGDKYTAYKDHVDNTTKLKTELDELRKMKAGEMNDIQTSRMNELKEMNLDDTTKRSELRKALDDTLTPMLKNSKLTESYREVARRGEAFTADLSKYKGKQKESVERAIKSGVLNNTYRSHELVDVLSKIEADKGIVFDYVNNEKLKETGFALEGKTVNGFANKSKGTVTLNVQSAKAWQSVVGHEVTHILEGTDAYDSLRTALYEYATSKGELESRRASLTKLYNGMDADIETELTADLVGDYLFTDKAFINKLTGNRNLFEKIYDEIKYLWNAATGKEKTEIEKVKAEFDKAWEQVKVESKAGATDGDVQYSLGYHAGDLGKAEFYHQQSGSRGTGHFGTGTYFVGDEAKISGDNTYGKRPHHAVEFDDYHLYKAKSDEDGYKLHSNLKVIDGGFSEDFLRAAKADEFKVSDLRKEAFDLTDEYDNRVFDEDLGFEVSSDYIGASIRAFTEIAEDNGVEIKGYDEWLSEQGEDAPTSSDSDYDFYKSDYLDYLKDTLADADTERNNGYEDFREAYFQLWLRFGKKNVDKALQAVIDHDSVMRPGGEADYFKEASMRADSRATVFMKSLGYEGIDVRGTALDNTAYGSVIYDLKNAGVPIEESGKVQYSVSPDDTYSRMHETQIEISKLNQSISEIERSGDFKARMSDIFNSGDDIAIQINKYQQLLEESGYGKLVERRDALKAELEKLRESFENEIASNGAEKERKAIEKSGLSEADYFRKQAVKEFGYTPYFVDAGYITPNGKMLNFSGEKGKHFGMRGQDHRAIGVIYETSVGTDALNRFVRDGNIRIMAESPGIDLSTVVEPTKEQYATIIKFVNEYESKGFFNVDLTDESGKVVGSLTYENRINPTRIINDIKHYYATGEIRQQSAVDRFSYSLSPETDADYMSAVERGDTETAQRMVDEAAKKAGYTRTLYHGTASNFNVFGFGRTGIFTTDNFDMAKTYGDNVMSLYGKEGANVLTIDAKESPHYAIRVDKEILDFSEYPLMRGKELYSTNDISLIAFREGYDVVVIKNVYDNYSSASGNTENGLGTDVVYKDANQVKSSEAITYDDNGNVIPLSQRFNAENDDKRYSLSKEGEDYAPIGDYSTPFRELALDAPVATDTNVGDTTTEAPMLKNIPVLPDEELDTGTYEGITPERNAQPKPPKQTTPIVDTKDMYVDAPTKNPKKPHWWNTFRTHFLDDASVFEDLGKKTKNPEIEAKFNFIKSAKARAQSLIGNGKKELGIKSLTSIHDAVMKTGKENDFEDYMHHLLNIDRMSMEDRFGTRNIAVFDYAITADISRQKVRQYQKENPEFKELASELYKYMRYERQLMVEGGLISQETADLWQKQTPHYIPIKRTGFDDGFSKSFDSDKSVKADGVVKKVRGGNQKMEHMWGVIAERTERVYSAIAKYRFGVELKNTLNSVIESDTASQEDIDNGVDKHEDLLQKGMDGKNPTFTVFENGKKVTFEISHDMYEALKPTDPMWQGTSKILGGLNNFRRGVLTEYSVPFIVTNAIKDAQDILMNSQHPTKTYASIPKAIDQLRHHTGYALEYFENGGEDITFFDKESGKIGEKKDHWLKRNTLGRISQANNFIEKIPRLAEYIASREGGASIEVAMLDAARVTTNFQAGGDITKFANRNGFTFLNASVQGALQAVRNVREAKMNGLKGWAQLAAKTMAMGLPALLLNALMWDDDEEYEDLSDYVKDNYYIVGKYGDGKFVRIPKGRAAAVIQNAFEQMGNLITGDDEVDLGRFLELVVNNLAPANPLENNVIAPITQAVSNKTWYGDDLVPTRLKDLPAKEQYDETTDSISKWLGEKTGTSPYKWNYVIDQYSGGVGDFVLPYLTPEAERGDNSLFAPILDKFTTDSVLKNQNVSDFYAKKDELTVTANGSDATDEDILKSKYMNSVNSELGELYRQKREIQNSSELSDADKYEAVRELQKQIVSLAEESLESYNEVYIDGDYAIVADRHYRWYVPGEDSETEPEWRKIDKKQLEKQNTVTRKLGITASEYWSNKDEYDFAYENPGKYQVALMVGGYDSYKAYDDIIGDFDAKDANGKTVNGLKKERIESYIMSLNLNMGEKAVLFKSYFPKDDYYSQYAVDYIANRSDLTYDEKVAILTEIGFKVVNGQIYDAD